MPDKAIDLVDEAAARLRLEIDSKPTNWMRSTGGHAVGDRACGAQEGEGRGQQGGAWMKSGAGAGEPAGASRALTAQWQQEKAQIERFRRQQRMESLQQEIERAERRNDFNERPPALRQSAAACRRRCAAAEAPGRKVQGDHPLLNYEVGPEEIARVVSTGRAFPSRA
jgi:ATP-dependent Clp protease ATP-binding subunit ClpB